MPQKKMNGFLYFMLEMKPRLIAQGKGKLTLSEGYQDVQPLCSSLWNELTAEEKNYYKQKAKEITRTINKIEKYQKGDKCAVNLAWKKQQEEIKADEKAKMHQDIENNISYLHKFKIVTQQYFHFAHFNFAVEIEGEEYPPCEVGIVKYSLLNGIVDFYHTYIDPDEIRLGFSFKARLHSEATHKIPATGFKLASGNYPEIANSIKEILQKSDGTLAPLFVLDEDIPITTFILRWLFNRSQQLNEDYGFPEPLNVFSLNKLVYELRRHADLHNNSLQFSDYLLVAKKLRCDTYTFCSNMACQFHEDEDKTNYCSLAIARKYAYNLSDFCCDFYGLTFLPDRHCPSSVLLDDKRSRLSPKVVPRPSDSQAPKVESECCPGSRQQGIPHLSPVHVQRSRLAANFQLFAIPRPPHGHAPLGPGSRLAANFQMGGLDSSRGALGAAALSDLSNSTLHSALLEL